MQTLLHNARVLTMNDTFDEYLCGWLVLEDEVILVVGQNEIPEVYKSADVVIDMNGDLIMPGMINTHCHMPMTLFRGLGEDVDDRLFRYILPLEREAITPEVVRIGANLAALEMMLGGVTTVADMYWFEYEIGRVLDVSGMRGIVGQSLADFNPPDHSTFDEGFAIVDDLRNEFCGNTRITASIAPHAPYSTGKKIMERVAKYAETYPEVKVQMHLAEMKTEMEWCEKNYKMRPVELADKSGILQPGAIMAHCLELNSEEIRILGERKIGVAHNPRSNAKAGRGIAPVEAMRHSGISVGLASDGPMSGNTLDIFAQLAPASMFAKILGKSRKCLPARDLIKMATIEGAKVLGLGDQVGSIETGKKADLIRVSLQDPRHNPIYDVYATLVFSGIATDVLDVMIDGKWVVKNRCPQTLDQGKVLRDAQQMAAKFKQKVAKIDATVLSGTV